MKRLNNKLIISLFVIFSNFFLVTNLFANEYLQETKEIKFTPELIKLAQELDHNPVKISNWVNENIIFESYHLSRKNALSTYWTKKGNTWDQSTLLITLLRISNIEARYVKYKDNNMVLVEALLPADNYRGHGNSSNKVWIEMVPWFSNRGYTSGVSVFPDENVPEELKMDFDEYVTSVNQQTTMEVFENKLQNYLNEKYPYLSLKNIVYKSETIKTNSSILPFSKPTTVENDFTIGENGITYYSEIPEEYKVKIDYFIKRATSGNETVLQHTFYLSEISSSRVVVDFVPYSDADKNIISTYGLISKTPANEANVKAVIKIDGNIVASSSSFKTGEMYIDAHEKGDQVVTRPSKKVGNILTLGFDTFSASEKYMNRLKDELANISTDVLNSDETKEEYLGRYLYIMNVQYRLRVYEAMEKSDNYLFIERETPADRFLVTRIYTFYDDLDISDNEKYLIHPSINIDASLDNAIIKKRGSSEALSNDSELAKLNRYLFMYTGSYNEGLIFEDWQSTPSASTIKTLMIAHEQNIPVVKLTKDDVVNGHLTVLESQTTNRYSDSRIQSIINSLQNNNAKITVPVQIVEYEGLKMEAWLEFDDNGDAYYFNGNNGGLSSWVPSIYDYTNVSTFTDDYFYNQSFTDINDDISNTNISYDYLSDFTYSDIFSDGDPVDMLSGEFYQDEKDDIAIKSSSNNKLSIQRTYKSQLDYNGIFGYGWAWSHMDRIIKVTDGSLLYVDNNAKFATITSNGDGTYTYPSGATYTLKYENNKYTISNKDKSQIIFDTNGLLIEKIDRNSNNILFSYNDKYQIVKIKDSANRELNLSYNENGKVSSVSDDFGRSTSYVYDDKDLISFTDLEENITQYEYLKNQENSANNHNMSKYILPSGDYLEIVYYKNDQVSHHTNKNGDTFNFQYSRYNKYSETWNEEGYYRKVFFNDNGDVVKVDKKDGTLEIKEYDENHNVLVATNANANKTTYTYDDRRNVLTKTNALDEMWQYEYDSVFNKIIKQTDPNGNITTYLYDAKGNLIEKTDPLLNVTKYEYDSFGNRIKVIDEKDQYIQNIYDSTGTNLVQIIDKNGNSTQYTYDGIGNKISIINAKDQTKTFEYNKNNQIVKQIDELDNSTVFEYDENKKLTKKILASGAVYENVYGVAKDIVTGALVKEVIDPLGNIEQYEYDKVGNKTKHTDRNNNVTKYTYNEINKVVLKVDPNQNITHYMYNGMGQLLNEHQIIKDSDSGLSKDIVTLYVYDNASRVIKKTMPNDLAWFYEYDNNGNRIKESYSLDGEVVSTTYEYNELNNIIKVVQASNSANPRVTTIEYDELQRKVKETNAIGIVTTYGYDNNSNLLTKKIDGIIVEQNQYNELNQLVSKTDANNHSITYAYDAKGQLVAKIDPLNNRYEYVYDEVGNIIEEILPSGYSKRYNYNLLNKPTEQTDGLNNTQYMEYDNNSNLVKVIDAKGYETSFVYNGLNQKVSKIDTLGNISTYSYDKFGNITSKVNENGDVVEYVYDISGNITKKREVLSLNNNIETNYTYDGLNRLVSIIDPKGSETSYTYNIFNEKISTTDALGNTIIQEYDDLGRTIRTTDAKGITSQIQYNSLSNPVKTIQAKDTTNQVVTTFTYDNVGNKVSQTRDGITTLYTYDELNRQTSIKVNGKTTSSLVYDSLGNIISKTDGNGNITTYQYNGNNKLVKQTDAKSNSFLFSYDKNNNQISQTTPEGIVVINQYDNLNRLVTRTVDNASESYSYDKVSRVLSKTDFKGIVTEQSYDNLGRVIEQIKAKNTVNEAITNYYYDLNSNLKAIKDANEKSITYDYDELNRKIKHTFASGKYQTYQYDENSNLTKTIKEDDTNIVNTYDELNRLVQVSVDGQIEQEYSYDNLSRLTQSIDHNQGRQTNKVTYAYDDLNNITKSTQNDKVINKTYDNNSNQINLSAESFEIVNQYNNLNLLENIKVNSNQIANFTYDKDQRISKISKANGITLDIEFDKRSRESKRTYTNNTFTQETKYDLNSNIIQEDITLLNQTTIKEYEYDSQDRLINDFSNNHTYNYDKVGNQIFTNQNGIEETREVNEDNQYTNITNTNIEYDDNGNVKTYQNKEFNYDYLNRLVELKENGTTIAIYTYDAQNRRVSKILNSTNTTTTYIYNNNQVIQEYENNTLTNSYIYASYIDDPIAYIYNNNTYYYVKDRQYSIRAVTNNLGNIVESYSYNSFGIITMKDENQNVISQSNVNNAITFTGRRYDKESNLYYYRNRMYSPELGRFISKDPKGYVDGMNLYAYVKNNPLKYVDAYGTIATNINDFSGTVFENWQDNYNRSFVDDFVNQSGDILSSTVDAVVNIPDILWGAGDYLAEVSGFKDYQNPSVVLGNHIQDEAIANTQEALTSFYNSYFTLEGLSQTYNDLTTYMDEEPGAFTADIFFMALPVPSKSLKVVDDFRFGPGDGRTHITYEGIKNNNPYIGYASMPGTDKSFREVLNYRYGNNFDTFDVKPEQIFLGNNQVGKDTARGLEQIFFEARGGLNGTANKQNPIGINNPNRQYYLDAGDKYLNNQ